MIRLRRIEGRSMLPSCRPGNLALFVRRRHLRPGDIVMARHNGLDKIKRIRIVRGQRLWLEGDNPAFSTDSRHFGWLPKRQILGVMIYQLAVGQKV